MELDGNSAALSAHEALQDKRQRAYDRLLPKAEVLLREWVRDGEITGKPARFGKLNVFILADAITDAHYEAGFDEEFVANLLTHSIILTDLDWLQATITHIGDNAYDKWLLTAQAEDALNNIVDYLEECEREEA